jgi:hypothetical protein
MKILIVDGEETLLIKEQGRGDGGIVLNYMVKEPGGAYSNYRHWFSDPAVAEAEYQATGIDQMRAFISLARMNTANEPIEALPSPARSSKVALR